MNEPFQAPFCPSCNGFMKPVRNGAMAECGNTASFQRGGTWHLRPAMQRSGLGIMRRITYEKVASERDSMTHSRRRSAASAPQPSK